MTKQEMICVKCIYSSKLTDDVFSKENIACRRLGNVTTTKGKKSWCGQGLWQTWSEQDKQFVCWSWGDWTPTEEEIAAGGK